MEKRFISWLQQPETTERGGGTKLARRGINPFNNKVYKKNKKLAIIALGLGVLLFLLPFVLGIILGKGK